MTYFDVPDEPDAAALHVVRDAPDTIATCLLRAVSKDFAIVGEMEIAVTSGADAQSVVDDPHRARASTASHGRLHCGQQRPR